MSQAIGSLQGRRYREGAGVVAPQILNLKISPSALSAFWMFAPPTLRP